MWKYFLKSSTAFIARHASKQKGKLLAMMKSGSKDAVGMAIGEVFGEQLTLNPYLQQLLTSPKNSKAFKKAFGKLRKENLPQMHSLEEIMKTLDIDDPREIVKDLKNKPAIVMNKINSLPTEKIKAIADAFTMDAEEAALSSSWLAYGTFKPGKNAFTGEIILTTKTGARFMTPPINKSIWDKMKNQIGITHYKDGKRKGSEYGAGTILHKYVPRKTWKKVTDE